MDARTCDSARRVDAPKKTLDATERDEQVRTAYRERVAARVAADFVSVDECGSNVNLPPL